MIRGALREQTNQLIPLKTSTLACLYYLAGTDLVDAEGILGSVE